MGRRRPVTTTPPPTPPESHRCGMPATAAILFWATSPRAGVSCQVGGTAPYIRSSSPLAARAPSIGIGGMRIRGIQLPDPGLDRSSQPSPSAYWSPLRGGKIASNTSFSLSVAPCVKSPPEQRRGCYGEVAYVGHRRAACRGESGTQDDIEDRGGRRVLDERAGLAPRQHLHRTAVAVAEVRRGVPA